MRRVLIILAILLAGLSALPGCSRRAPAPGPARLAVLMAGPARQAKVDGLVGGLQALGFRPGRDYELQVWDAKDDPDRLPALAQELLVWRPDVLVGTGTIEASHLLPPAAAQRLPLVLVGVGATRETGLIPDPRSPGAPVTGVENQVGTLTGKRLELMTLLVPGTRRVLALYDPRIPASVAALEIAQAAAAQLGLELATVQVSHRVDILRIEPVPVDGILPMPGFVFEDATPELAALSRRLRAPLMGLEERQAEGGYLAAYGAPFRAQGYQAARLLAKVLHGVPVAEIPLEVPDRLELVVNPGVARELGLTLGPVGLGFARLLPEGGGGP